MHDRNGTPLMVGDKVMLPAVITDVQAHADYCNATVRLLPMRGAGERAELWTGNTGQLVLIEANRKPGQEV